MKRANLFYTMACVLAIALTPGCSKKSDTYSTQTTTGYGNNGNNGSALTLGSNSPVAVGGTLYLTASTISTATYYWTGPASFISALQNPSRANFSVADAGTYTCTATTSGAYGTAYTAIISVASK